MLSPHSHECVFIGYSPLHKGYKYFNLHSKKIHIYRHVVFHENIYTYQSHLLFPQILIFPLPPLYPITLNPYANVLSIPCKRDSNFESLNQNKLLLFSPPLRRILHLHLTIKNLNPFIGIKPCVKSTLLFINKRP